MPKDGIKMQNKSDKRSRYDKEDLFENFFHAARHALEDFELQFGLDDVVSKLFGESGEDAAERQRLRDSHPWWTLSALYEYSLNGVLHDGHDRADSLVIDGSSVLKLVDTEDQSPCADWWNLVAMGDGRYALDSGEGVMLEKLALLANVDARTVRNAISAGALTAWKKGDYVSVDNASARRWLHGKRGFKPTASSAGRALSSLKDVQTPVEFGAFLQAQRHRIDAGSDDLRTTPHHASVTKESIEQLEAGIFSLPLDTVFPLADFYLFGRKDFLDCVMRVFFEHELMVLQGTSSD